MDDETRVAFAALNERFDTFASRLDAMDGKLDSHTDAHKDHTVRLSNIERSLDLQSGSVADLAESVTDRLREVADLNGKTDVIESKIDDANRMLQGCAKETSLKQLRSEHSAFQRVLNDTLIKTNRRVDDHDGRIDKLEDQLART